MQCIYGGREQGEKSHSRKSVFHWESRAHIRPYPITRCFFAFFRPPLWMEPLKVTEKVLLKWDLLCSCLTLKVIPFRWRTKKTHTNHSDDISSIQMCVCIRFPLVRSQQDGHIYFSYISSICCHKSLTPSCTQTNCHAFVVCVLYCNKRTREILHGTIQTETFHFLLRILNDGNHSRQSWAGINFWFMFVTVQIRETIKLALTHSFTPETRKVWNGMNTQKIGKKHVVTTFERYYFQFNFRFFV